MHGGTQGKIIGVDYLEQWVSEARSTLRGVGKTRMAVIARSILAMSLVFSVCACTFGNNSPKHVVDAYFRALARDDYAEAMKHISAKDVPLMKAKLLAASGNQSCGIVAWESSDVTTNGDVGSVKVKVTMKNIGAAMGNNLAKTIRDELMPEKDAARPSASTGMPSDMVVAESAIKVIREAREWKVSLGLEEKGRIAAIIKEALQLKTAGEKSKAIEKLRTALTIERDNGLVTYLLGHWEAENKQ